MELRHIRLFCLIMEQGGVSKAATRAGLGQPTVSQHLKALEEELGILLFERRGKRILPTKAAHAFYPYAKQALQSLEAGKRALEEQMGLVRGILEIAGSTIPGHYILPKLMAQFHKSFPGVQIRVDVGDTQEVVEKVRLAEVELGFVGAKVHVEGMNFDPFSWDELVLVALPSHPMANKCVSIEELGSLELVTREPGSGTRKSWEEQLLKRGFDLESLNIVAQLGSTEALIRAVKAGLGVGIVSFWAASEELKNGALARIQLEGPPMKRDFYMIWMAHRPMSPAAQRFAQMAMAQKELPGSP